MTDVRRRQLAQEAEDQAQAASAADEVLGIADEGHCRICSGPHDTLRCPLPKPRNSDEIERDLRTTTLATFFVENRNSVADVQLLSEEAWTLAASVAGCQAPAGPIAKFIVMVKMKRMIAERENTEPTTERDLR